jgi:hypothetical protein
MPILKNTMHSLALNPSSHCILHRFWVNLLVSVVVEYYTKLVQERGDILMSKQAKVGG